MKQTPTQKHNKTEKPKVFFSPSPICVFLFFCQLNRDWSQLRRRNLSWENSLIRLACKQVSKSSVCICKVGDSCLIIDVGEPTVGSTIPEQEVLAFMKKQDE